MINEETEYLKFSNYNYSGSTPVVQELKDGTVALVVWTRWDGAREIVAVRRMQ